MSELEANGNLENELRFGLVNDVLDRISTIATAHPLTLHMNIHEQHYGLDATALSDENLAKSQKVFTDSIERVRSRWMKRREAAFRPFVVESATMETLRNPNGEFLSLVTVATTYGGTTRYGMLKLFDEGLTHMCTMYADQDCKTDTYLTVEMPQDDYFKSMMRRLSGDPELMKQFIHIYYGSYDVNHLEQTFNKIRGKILDDVDETEADVIIAELQQRYRTAVEVNELKDQIGDSNQMSDTDIVRMCDMLDRRAEA